MNRKWTSDEVKTLRFYAKEIACGAKTYWQCCKYYSSVTDNSFERTRTKLKALVAEVKRETQP